MRLFALFIISLMFSLQSAALESGWLDGYVLSDTQIRLLTNWQAKGSFSDERLLQLAQSFHKTNTQAKPYVPPHTFNELNEVMHWAQGAAFASFAQFAGVTFDNVAYNEDCPNRIIFNFGRATGTAYFQLDVLRLAEQTFSSLQIMYSHHPETFPQEFLRLAMERGFDAYITPLPTLQASLE